MHAAHRLFHRRTQEKKKKNRFQTQIAQTNTKKTNEKTLNTVVLQTPVYNNLKQLEKSRYEAETMRKERLMTYCSLCPCVVVVVVVMYMCFGNGWKIDR